MKDRSPLSFPPPVPKTIYKTSIRYPRYYLSIHYLLQVSLRLPEDTRGLPEDAPMAVLLSLLLVSLACFSLATIPPDYPRSTNRLLQDGPRAVLLSLPQGFPLTIPRTTE